MNQICPHCYSIDSTWKPKAAKWECNSCEERFDGPAPDSASPSPKPSLSDKAANPKKIFFSYGHDANRELVDLFKADLEKRGHTVWIDYKEIGTWSDWKGKITQGIHDSGMAIAFLSLHSTRDPGVCRNEIAMALHHFGVVYPVMVEQVPFDSIPVTIAHLQWPDLTQWKEKKESDLDFERWYEEKLLEIVNRIEGEATRFASEIDVLRKVLRPSTFEGKFAQHLEGFVGREWVFSAYEQWLEHQPDSRVFWLNAGPGFGKSALAVNLADRFRGAIIGTWFCDSQSVELRDPLRAVMTIAFQLATRWDDYRTRLLPRLGLFEGSCQAQIDEAIQTLAKKNLDDLFTLLISEPMAGLIWREHKLVILMDALDEATDSDGKNPLTALIAGRFLELPSWISFVVTSRPDASVVGHLQRFKPFELSAEDSRNTGDLALYCRKEIGGLKVLESLSDEEKEKLCTRLVEKAEGMILYLRMVAEGLKEGKLSVSDLDSMEGGLGGLYSRYHQTFSSRFSSDFVEKTQPLLRLVMAAPGPLPLDLAAEVLGWSKEKIRKVRAKIGSYLEGGPEGVRIFHKTIGEWLGSESSGEFFTDPESGKKQIGEFLWECFEQREKDQNEITKPLNYEKEVLDWLPSLIPATDKTQDSKFIGDLGLLLNERCLYDKAINLLQTCVQIREKTLAKDDPKTLASLTALAVTLSNQGDFFQAEAIHHRVLEVREKTLGLEHPDLISSLNGLAGTAWQLGKLVDAENFMRRALTISEKSLQEDDPKTLTLMSNLGVCLKRSNQYDEAESLLKRVLDARKKLLGPDHRDTLVSLSNLGSLYIDKGELVRGQELTEKAYQGQKKTLGKDHSVTLNSLQNLAKVLLEECKYKESEDLFREAQEIYERTLGLNHPETLNCLSSLLAPLAFQDKYGEAEEIAQKVLEARNRILGPDHPQTMKSKDNLERIKKLMDRSK
jgi:tetratricopeptide (TPR) repeat protein